MTEFGDKNDGISRRDFLDGVAISAAGLAAAAAAPHLTGAEALAHSRGHGHGPAPLPPDYFPPTVTGLKGQPDHVVKDIMRIDGRPNQRDVHSTRGGPGIHVRHIRDSDETYDCVIVGAGAGGLAAAKYYRDRFGEDSKILLLDPLPDFGGHSHRNEFHVGPTTFLKNGGTVNLDSTGTWNETTGGLMDIPGSYGQPALDLIHELGVDPETFPDLTSANLGLRTMLLFPAKDWGGKDYVVPNRLGPQDWTEWLKTTPWSPEAQAAIVRIQEGAPPTGSWPSTARRPSRRRWRSSPGSPRSATTWTTSGRRSRRSASTSATATGCSERVRRPSRPATCGRSARRGSKDWGWTSSRSSASGARRSSCCWKRWRSRRRRRGRTATRRCCACWSTG